MNLKSKAQKLKMDIPAISLALRKKETPIFAKIFAIMTVGYVLSPVDLIPDFVPVLGYIDDIVLLPVLVSITIMFIPKHIMEQCRIDAEGMWMNGKPKKWYYAIPVVIIWVILLRLIMRRI